MPVSANRVSCTYLQQSSICGRFTSWTLGVTTMPQKLTDDFQRDSSPQATKACVGKDVHDIVESKLAREPNNALFSSYCYHDHEHDV